MAQSATDLEFGSPLGPAVEPGAEEGIKARTPFEIFWARFKQDRLAFFGAFLVLLMILAAVTANFWESVTGHPFDYQFRGKGDDPQMLNAFGTPKGPNSDFWFGADDLSRDLFVRVMHGARTSLGIGVVATGIEVAIGVLLGLLAGYYRGWIDTVISRGIDLILSIPFLLLAIALSVSPPPGLDQGFGLVTFLLVFFGWPYIARVIRGQTLSLREAQFVEAAQSLGASTRWIMFREILPNLVAPIIVYSTLIIPVNIVAEAALSFLGVGVQEPDASWGAMLSDASKYVSYGAAWWYMVYPGLFLFLTVLGFNLLGDGLRDALDPKSNR